jgi:RNA polymerase sigma-70 factor (ECF subfamily)
MTAEGTARPGGQEDVDGELMARAARGDRSAFDELYARHWGPVVRFARGFVGSTARAEELAQDIFVQVYKARERWEPRARFTTWLYTIAHNRCSNERRRFDYRGRIGTLENLDGEPLPYADERGTSGEERVSTGELQARLSALLAGLPDNQRSALLLSRVEGLRYREIAEVLDCSESAVKSLVFRATQSLKEGLKEWIEVEP